MLAPLIAPSHLQRTVEAVTCTNR